MFFTVAVQFAGASSVLTALNFLVTIITMRAPGMSFWRMPLLVWANFSTSLLVVIATPFIAASQFFVLLDRALGFNFFNAAEGGSVLMYQHVFWFYSHPAVYIMMLPGFGIISEILSVKARKPIFGYRMMAFSLLAIVAREQREARHAMTNIHPSAVVHRKSQVGADCEVGPYCVIGEHVVLGEGCRLHSHVVIDGHTKLGQKNEVFPFVSIGLRTQDLKWKGGATITEIGDDNTFREHVTVHSATGGGDITRIGSINHLNLSPDLLASTMQLFLSEQADRQAAA